MTSCRLNNISSIASPTNKGLFICTYSHRSDAPEFLHTRMHIVSSCPGVCTQLSSLICVVFFSDSFGSSGLVQEESLHNKFCAKAPRELQGLSEHEQKQKRKVQFSSKHHVHLCSAKQDWTPREPHSLPPFGLTDPHSDGPFFWANEHEQAQKRKVQFSSKHHVHLGSAKQDWRHGNQHFCILMA